VIKENSEIPELKADELDAVSGGFVLVPRPPVGPAYPAPSPTSNPPPPGGFDPPPGAGDGGTPTVEYTGDPYAIHHLF
jgi:hypothetical protein